MKARVGQTIHLVNAKCDSESKMNIKDRFASS